MRHCVDLPRHRPPHDPTRGQAIFLTASTYRRVPYLRTPSRRDYFRDLLLTLTAEFEIEVLAWVVLHEHYHMVLIPADPDRFAVWIQAVHEESATRWNGEDDRVGRQAWYQYWDRSLWTDGDVWSRVNYVHWNPVKHGYVQNPEDWPWSSYREVMAAIDGTPDAELQRRFPAPRRVPGDDF